MNNEGAIFVLKALRDMHLGIANDDALTMAIAALEKQEPVKPTGIRNYGDKEKVGFCPVCREGANSYMKYCEECGQRLNWTEDAE